MVDKVVDFGWKKQTTTEKLHTSTETLPPPHEYSKTSEGYQARLLAVLMSFVMSSICHVKKKLCDDASNQTPTPSPKPSLIEGKVLTSVVKRLGELEEKVKTLQEKPSEMPYDKEELLNAAIYRVDALEAKLIAIKKVLPDQTTHVSAGIPILL